MTLAPKTETPMTLIISNEKIYVLLTLNGVVPKVEDPFGAGAAAKY